GPETPWHISRFYPAYDLLELPQTPVETLEIARQIGLQAGLRYVYVGNVPGSDGSNTYCYNCGKLLIRRYVNNVLENKTIDGYCYNCKTKIDGVGI
ncbi:MAG: radical SAM protein, partial [Chloroflexi bacterium]|nr:radical SAM protein [Chloroflexota bacterium]